MFITGSYDKSVKVWDTNIQMPVSQFQLPARVTSTAMSSASGAGSISHSLIAVGCQENNVRLCDIGSRALAQTLSGHR